MPSTISCFRAECVDDCSIASITLVKLLGVLAVSGLPKTLCLNVKPKYLDLFIIVS